MKDPWKSLRGGLFGNTEPEVTLEAATHPIFLGNHESHEIAGELGDTLNEEGLFVDWPRIESLPAVAAGTSYGSRGALEGDPNRAIGLNRLLIKKGHHTPLEAIQFNFHISGISKACGAQISRHRIGQGHVSASRRFQEQEPKFVYPMLSYLSDKDDADLMLKNIETTYTDAIEEYNNLRKGGVKKEDARLVMPISVATERSWWVNARALRDFFRLRLAPDAEWEIRRLANMILDIVKPLTPSLFEDFAQGGGS